MTAREWNFDGLVGPTHHYGGLGLGNLASQANRAEASNPRAAALQGLAKMRAVAALGVPQAVLPPHDRPSVAHLRTLGFEGTDRQVVLAAGRHAPELLSALSSASSMWAANAATVSPSADTGDGRLHLTPANLVSQLHRSVEAPTTTAVLRAVFRGVPDVVVHDPLPPTSELGDEGAANHSRFAADHGSAGVELFVHGGPGGRRFRPRQTRLAGQAVARRHLLDPARVVHAEQSAAAIDAGVFHNDVIAVADRDVLLVHELAYDDTAGVVRRLREVAGQAGLALRIGTVPTTALTIGDAVSSYLFNSQLLSTPSGRRVLLAPVEVQQTPSAAAAVAELGDLVDEAIYLDLRQSMRNGGGPACLRLRVVLTHDQAGSVASGVVFDDDLAGTLEGWVARHYRDHLLPGDVADPRLLEESRAALDDLTGILGLGPVYDFQQV